MVLVISEEVTLTFNDGKKDKLLKVNFAGAGSLLKLYSVGNQFKQFKLVGVEGSGRIAGLLKAEMEKRKQLGEAYKPDYTFLIKEFMGN